jgi:hypothetical protein
MWVRTTQLLFIAMMGSAIAVFAAQSVPSKSSPSTDEDRMLLGTWKLNVGKSKYRIGTPPKSQTRVYEPHEQGVKATIKTVYADGRSTTVEYTANYDALEYPVTGTQDVDTIALKKVASRTAEAVLSHAGKVMATARRVISEDGSTLTIEYQGELLGERVDYTAVYDKQQ